VGEYNVRFFHAFLLSTATLCTYCGYLAGMVLWGMMQQRGLLSMTMKDPSGRLIPIPYTYIFQYCVVNGGTTFALGTFCAIIAVVLYAFWAYHFYLIVQNTTTNETYKWGDYAKYVKYYLENHKEELNKEQPIKVKKTGKKGRSDTDEEMPPPKFKVNAKGRYIFKNTYDKGFLGNVWELLSPPSYRSGKKKE